VKAVLANGAQFVKGVQAGGTTTVLRDQPVRPYDNNQNMGEANLLASLPLRGDNDFNIFVQNDTPLSGEKSWYLDLVLDDECAADLSATLTWYDPPGAIGCLQCLTNDLDLRLDNLSSARSYYPNGKTTPDTMNNIERVRVARRRTAHGNRFKVTVTASMLGPGHSFQNFSLVVTGCFRSVHEEKPSAEGHPVPTQNKLTVTHQADRKQAGNMFGVQAKADGVAITGFAIRTQLRGRKIKLQVYTLNDQGGLNGDEAFLDDPAAWTMVSPPGGVEVLAMGMGSPTIVPRGSFAPVSIAKGMTQSFYITFVEEAEMLFKAVDSVYPTGAMYASDDNIAVMTGVGKALNFGTNWQSRQMTGAVFYSVLGSDEARKETSALTKRPTVQPTEHPTIQIPLDHPVEIMELITTYKANKKQAGNMFDVFAKQGVAIVSFKIHTLLKRTVSATIYTRLGSWKGYDKNLLAWEKIATVDVDCKGHGAATTVEGMEPITLGSGDTRAFYLTLDAPELLYYYSTELPSGAVAAEDPAVKVMTGVGKAGHFGATYLSRQLNGAVLYHLL